MRLYSNNLLGDTLLQTPALRAWSIAHENEPLEYYCGPTAGAFSLLQYNRSVTSVISCDSPPDNIDISMDAAVAFGLGASNGKTLSWGYGQMLGVEIDSLKYDYHTTLEERVWANYKLSEFNKPVVLIARHSASCTSNDPRIRTPNKCVTNRYWVQVANWLLSEGFLPVAIGSSKDALDTRYNDWPGVKLYGEDIRNIAALCKMSVAVLTVDNGIRHITAAAGGNMFCLSGRIPLQLIRCEPVYPDQKIHEIYKELPYVTAAHIVEGAKKVIK